MNKQDERYMEVANRMQLLALGKAAGVVYWQPAGAKLYEKLRSFIRAEHEERSYQEVKSPSIVELELFERSGHLSKYREKVFCLNQANGHEGNQDLDMGGYALRPMSCPNHILLYKAQRRSYRELPLKLFEFGEVFRNEDSGSLQVLFRARQFVQDDSHVFAAQSQVVDVLADYLAMAQQAYRKLGFESISYAISLRPEMRFGDDASWDKAEESLREACRRNGLAWDELEGDGAFYGPKIELQVKDKLGRSWQLGVIQLDYVLPERFDMKFINDRGEEEVPVILHHAVLGSLERMIGILLESFGVKLPEFLHPHEAVVVPVSEKSLEYGRACHQRLKGKWKDALLDVSDEPLGAKLKKWRERGIPNIFVVGEKEVAEHAESGNFPASLGREKVLL